MVSEKENMGVLRVNRFCRYSILYLNFCHLFFLREIILKYPMMILSNIMIFYYLYTSRTFFSYASKSKLLWCILNLLLINGFVHNNTSNHCTKKACRINSLERLKVWKLSSSTHLIQDYYEQPGYCFVFPLIL